MMRPLGLYLAEFRPGGVPAGAAPAGAPLPLLPDLTEESGFPALPAPDHASPSSFDADSFPERDDAEPLPALDPPDEPGPDLAMALAAQAAEHEAALAAARARWAAAEGAVLAERIGTAFAELEARLAAALAPLLEPFLARAAQATALDGLHDALTTLLDGGDARPITVSGPADLLAALRDRVGGRPGLGFTEAEAPDVTIALGDTRIRSQLRAWARKLESALGAPA